MPPKKPFRLPKLPKKPTKQEPVLTTPQDYLDQGVEEEESGDRWLLSDLSKSLRFYQKAYELYLVAIKLNSKLIDAYYNANRLLFHVYENYKNVQRVDLINVEGCDVLQFGLDDIKRNHEDIIKKFHDMNEEKLINWDLYYNLILINIEWIESRGSQTSTEDGLSEIEGVLNDSVIIVNKILDYQLSELDLFIKRLENPLDDESPEDHEINEDNVRQDGIPQEGSYDVIEQITPSVVFETVLTCLKLVQASYEATDNSIQLNYLRESLKPLISRIEEIVSLLLRKFDPLLNPDDVFNINLKKEDIEELRLRKLYIDGLFIDDFKKLQDIWKNGGEILQTSSTYLVEADSYESFKENHPELKSEELWEIINIINQTLKKAQEAVRIELQEQINNRTNKVSEKVSKSIEILINRADNELIRSSMDDLEVALKNKEVLKQNSINLLKNGLTLSNTNVGLRESISDKLKRIKLRRECTVRLIVITKDIFTEEDFIRNLGSEYYKLEVEELRNIDVYKPFFLKNSHQTTST